MAELCNANVRKNLQRIQERGIMKRALPMMLLLVFIVTASGAIKFVQEKRFGRINETDCAGG
jgi:cell division protein FtsL